MKQLTAIIIGAGGRGRGYSKFVLNNPEMYEVVGVAEPIDVRRNLIIERHPKAAEAAYKCWTEILARPRFADIAIITTMDRMHIEPALRAIELGYDILLEKPLAATPEDCKRLVEAAEAKGTRVLICHVLRYTPFFRALREIIDSGRLGRVISVIHTEGVGHIHQSHSYVRGNWRKESESSFMLLAKSCHDLDILQWLIGRECRRIQSFGSLSYFTHENRPEGAPDYCLDGCPHSATCCYDAEKVYVRNTGGWMRAHACDLKDPTEAELREYFHHSPYGRCVFACDNDVVDHQTVNMEFDDGCTVTFNMNAFNIGGRTIRIMGTKGELEAWMDRDYINFSNLVTGETEQISIKDAIGDESIAGGHGGGDGGIMRALYDMIACGIESKSVCDVRTAYKNHLLAFAAEQSRHTGKVIDLAEYEASIK